MNNEDFHIPATLGECADKLFTLRQTRYDLQKEVDRLSRYEAALREHLIAQLPEQGASGVAGSKARVTMVAKQVPQVTDWDALRDFVQKTKSFDLLQKRVADAAIKERWEHGDTVPGVEPVEIITLSVNKA